MHALRTWSRRQLMIGALALALLFMQGLGLVHAIVHAGLANQSTPTVALQADDDAGVTSGADNGADNRIGDAHHSCAAFNALTLAFALALSGLAALLTARSRAPRQAPAPSGRVVTPHRPYLSRGPPILLV